ncbi:MAG: Inward rectifier potassium channel Irk [Ferruginibacter sp.]|nr:Inward rectifier potassium channel Irk [Chitinophagaceae bacterium]
MALMKKPRNLRTDNNTGFGTNSTSTGGRFVNRDGRPNVIKKGIGILNRYSWYHTMLGMNRGKFLFLLFIIYISVNLVFAGVYYLIGIDHLAGVHAGSSWKNFTEVFFFSAQTFTTVGYGRISPVGFMASAVSTFEAFLGLLSFAIATGLFYGRFSRPRAFLKFSENALIAPYQEGTALMFRMSPYKNNMLSEVEIKLTMAITTSEEDGRLTDKFFTLDMELSKINSLSLSWTIVHPITETSPFYGFSKEDIANTDIEIMVFVKGFDEVFSNNVVTRTSYVSAEIIWGAKFRMMYHPNDDKSKTILDLDKLNDYDQVSLSETAIAASINSVQAPAG